MYGLSAFVLSALPLAALAANPHEGSARNRHRHVHVKRGTAYNLTDMYKGQSFFNDWDFFTGPDPTNGLVNYLSQSDAQSKGLAYVQSDNTTVLAVDDTSTVASGGNRNSVRISSKKSYSGGLFIADFWSMPSGCGTWPAWWSTGPNWPNAGEIDIIEGVNGQGTNQMTLHSDAGCTLDNSTINQSNTANGTSLELFTAHILGTECESTNSNNAGCAFLDSDTRSFGPSFNNASGGVFAHLWDDSGIKIWHFARSDIPADITSNNPDPTSWPTPAAFWSAATCDMKSHFYQHSLTLDITICGGWAGSAYPQSGCPGTCADAVADPSNFSAAKWEVNYIAVYNGVTSS